MIGLAPARIAAAVFLAASLTGAEAPEPWSRFRGPNGTGIADIPTLPDRLDPAANLRWEAPVPSGYSSPVVYDGQVYLTGEDHGELLTLAFNAADGKLLWQAAAPRARNEKVDKRNGPASPSPVASAEGVVVFFGDYGLVAYDRKGKQQWKTPLGPFHNVYGVGASPVLVDGSIILGCDQGPDSFIAAFDRKTGRQRWRTPRPDALSGHSTPIVYRPGNAPAQIVAPGSFRMDAYSLSSGEAVWWVEGLPSEMKSTPSLVEVNGKQRLFVSGYAMPENDPGKQVNLPEFAEVLAKSDQDKDGRLAVTESPDARTKSYFPFVDLDSNGTLDEAEWRKFRQMLSAENALLAIEPGGRGDRTGSAFQWKYHRGIPQLPSPVVYRGIVYMVGDRGILTTLNASTGEVLAQTRAGASPDDYYASPVAGNGKVYLASKGGRLTVLEAGGSQKVLFSAQLDGEIFGTPALTADGVLVRSGRRLLCFR